MLPEFQGLGLGPGLSNATGARLVALGFRYISRTAHPRFGAYREASPLWEPTKSNLTAFENVTVYSKRQREQNTKERGTALVKAEKQRMLTLTLTLTLPLTLPLPLP